MKSGQMEYDEELDVWTTSFTIEPEDEAGSWAFGSINIINIRLHELKNSFVITRMDGFS